MQISKRQPCFFYYMVSFALPYNRCKYFKAKSKRQIKAYCKVEHQYTVIEIFNPSNQPTDGVEYIDISNFKIGEQKLRKSIKQRLAEKVNKDLDLPVIFYEDDFKRNYGANRKNDWCIWTATSGSVQLASFTSMTELINQKEKLVFIGERGIGPNEIA